MDKSDLAKAIDVAGKPLVYQGTTLTESNKQQLNAMLESALNDK